MGETLAAFQDATASEEDQLHSWRAHHALVIRSRRASELKFAVRQTIETMPAPDRRRFDENEASSLSDTVAESLLALFDEPPPDNCQTEIDAEKIFIDAVLERTQARPVNALVQVLEGVVRSVSNDAIEIDFDVDGMSEIREYRLTDLSLGDRKPEKYDRVRGTWTLEFLPPSKGMTDQEVKAWKKRRRWDQKRQLKLHKPKALLSEEDDEKTAG